MALFKRADDFGELSPTESHLKIVPSTARSALLSPHGPPRLRSTESNENGRPSDMQAEGCSFMDRGVQVESARLVELMQVMKRMARLHKQAISAQITTRQKRRAAGFKRRDVWVCDAAFMKQLQKLMAEEKLKGFEGAQELFKLAEDCQIVRNELGPLEQEGTEAEQQLEGVVWKLQQAAESMYDDFEGEFTSAEMYPSVPTSASSSSYQSEAEPGNESTSDGTKDNHITVQRLPNSVASISSFKLAVPGPESYSTLDTDPSQDYMLRGVNGMFYFRGANPSESDSAIGDIDLSYEEGSPGDLTNPFQHVERNSSTSLERYPELITEIETPRERINKWLLNTTLLSHFEADILRQQLDSRMKLTPSNWSQLVIAYWDSDEAAAPPPKNASEESIQRIKTGGGKHVGEIVPQTHIKRRGLGSDTHIRDPIKLSMPANDHGAFLDFVPRRRKHMERVFPSRPAPTAPHPQRLSDVVNKVYQEVPKNLEPP
jgi:hypothetical protein